MKPIALLIVPFILPLAACAEESVDLGPMEYDASGVMACSAGVASYDEACGWRMVRKADGGAEIWISNIAVSDRPAYRVLDFSQGEFTARDGTSLDIGKTGNTWLVSVPGQEYYRFDGAKIIDG